jgi:hypothetical protein
MVRVLLLIMVVLVAAVLGLRPFLQGEREIPQALLHRKAMMGVTETHLLVVVGVVEQLTQDKTPLVLTLATAAMEPYLRLQAHP